MSNFASILLVIITVLLNVCIRMQVKMNHDKYVREHIESCIIHIIDEQDAHNSK